MKHCPVCRARFSGNSVCRRCKADLSSLIQLEEQAKNALRRGIHALAAGNIAAARNLCGYAQNIKKTSLGKALDGFLAFQSVKHRLER